MSDFFFTDLPLHPVQRILQQSNTTVYSIPDIGLDSARAGSAARITVLELLENTRRELLNAPSFGDMEHAEGMLQLASFMQQLQDVSFDTVE